MSFSEKSNEEISKMLDEFGLKHGPVQGRNFFCVHFTADFTVMHVFFLLNHLFCQTTTIMVHFSKSHDESPSSEASNHNLFTDTTRKLYEKRLEKATKSQARSSSDKTFYREEGRTSAAQPRLKKHANSQGLTP